MVEEKIDTEEWMNQGLTHYEAENYDEAIKYLNAVVINDRENTNAWLHLGFCYEKTEKYSLAKSCLDRVIEQNPSEEIKSIAQKHRDNLREKINVQNKISELIHFRLFRRWNTRRKR